MWLVPGGTLLAGLRARMIDGDHWVLCLPRLLHQYWCASKASWGTEVLLMATSDRLSLSHPTKIGAHQYRSSHWWAPIRAKQLSVSLPCIFVGWLRGRQSLHGCHQWDFGPPALLTHVQYWCSRLVAVIPSKYHLSWCDFLGKADLTHVWSLHTSSTYRGSLRWVWH